jgi:cob(I)alamin adenosyltransferase
MSISTKTGDSGATGLMYNRRVPKSHPRVEAYGCVDELSTALGLARAAAAADALRSRLQHIQEDLIILMGELATDPADLPRYAADGFKRVGAALTGGLDALVAELEAHAPPVKGWALPGANMPAAALDLARVTCRRAERRVCALRELEPGTNPEIVVYLNRLADVLWLLARRAEASG